MSQSSVSHATFAIERTYDGVSPAAVYEAWSDPVAKRAWFGGGPEGWTSSPHELDFRVGGREHAAGGPEGGPVFTFDAVYADIVANQRIVWTYTMYQDETRISVSLATVELAPAEDGDGTRLTYTEQGAFFDDLDNVKEREEGTHQLLDGLTAYLEARR